MDRQTCSLEFEVWETTKFVNITSFGLEIMDRANFIGNGQLWVLEGIEAVGLQRVYESEEENSYSHGSFRIRVRRTITYYIGSMFIPLGALSIIQNMAVSCLPYSLVKVDFFFI